MVYIVHKADEEATIAFKTNSLEEAMTKVRSGGCIVAWRKWEPQWSFVKEA